MNHWINVLIEIIGIGMVAYVLVWAITNLPLIDFAKQVGKVLIIVVASLVVIGLIFGWVHPIILISHP